MGTSAWIAFCFTDRTYGCYSWHNGDTMGLELYVFLRRLVPEQWTKLGEKLCKDVSWVQEYDEVDEAVKEYKEKYRSSDYCRESIMKGYLSKATFHPGWALKEILSGKLCHLIHFDPKDESGASPDQAEYCYAIDFDTHKFYMQSRNRLELENVPLENISREKAKYKRARDRRRREKVKFETAKKRMEMLNQLCVFDNGKTARTKRLLKQGPE